MERPYNQGALLVLEGGEEGDASEAAAAELEGGDVVERAGGEDREALAEDVEAEVSLAPGVVPGARVEAAEVPEEDLAGVGEGGVKEVSGDLLKEEEIDGESGADQGDLLELAERLGLLMSMEVQGKNPQGLRRFGGDGRDQANGVEAAEAVRSREGAAGIVGPGVVEEELVLVEPVGQLDGGGEGAGFVGGRGEGGEPPAEGGAGDVGGGDPGSPHPEARERHGELYPGAAFEEKFSEARRGRRGRCRP
jgi:hypothetical protein